MPGHLSWRPFFVVSAIRLLVGGFQHPNGTMEEMLGYPTWVRSHIFTLTGFVALIGGLLVLRSGGGLPMATRRWTRLAVVGTTLLAVEMVLHTAAFVDHANLLQGNPTPVLTTHLAAAVVFYPIFTTLFVGFIVVAARDRVVGSHWISWLGIAGLVAYGFAPPLVALGIRGRDPFVSAPDLVRRVAGFSCALAVRFRSGSGSVGDRCLMSLQPGTTLGPYSVTAKIGEGGMGEKLCRP